MKTALGFRAHSGWAAVVAVAGTRQSIEILDRRRIGIADPEIPGSKQPFHAAEGQTLEKAAEYLRRCEQHSKRLCQKAFREILKDLEEKDAEVAACGLLLASGRPLPGLASILASHAFIHTADGEHFRDAIRKTAEGLELPITEVREKELSARASVELRIPIQEIPLRFTELGRGIGPPWTQDQKLATLAAWLALAAAGRS